MADEELNNGGQGGNEGGSNEQTPVISQVKGKDSTLIIGGQKVYPRTFLHNVYGEDGTTTLSTTLATLSGEHDILSARITANDQALTNHNGRIVTLEGKVGNEANNTDPEHPVAATGLIGDVRTLQSENTAVKGRVSALETQVGREADNTDPEHPVAATGLVADLRAAEADIDAIEAVIPAAATSSNKLVDKAAMDEAIETLAGSYVTSDANGSSFATKLALVGADAIPGVDEDDPGTPAVIPVYYRGGQVYTPNKNDYAIVAADESKASAGTPAPTSRYIYDGTQWAFQYIVHNTALTQAQIDAMNSGLTSSGLSTINSTLEDHEDRIGDIEDIIGTGDSTFSIVERLDTIEDTLNGTDNEETSVHTKGVVENLADVMSDLNTASTGLKARMSTAENDIDALESNLGVASDPANSVTATGLHADVEALQSDVGHASSGSGAGAVAATGLHAAVETNASDIDALEGRMDTAEGDIDDLESALGHDADAQNSVSATGLFADVRAAEGDIDALQAQVGSEASGNDPATGLVADIRAAESDIDALETDLGHASSSGVAATGLHADVEENAADIAALEALVGQPASGNDAATGLHAAVAQNASDIATNAANISDIIDILAGDPEDAESSGLVSRLTAAESAIGRIGEVEEILNGTDTVVDNETVHTNGVVENLGAPNAAASNTSAFGRIKTLEDEINGTGEAPNHVKGLSERVYDLEHGSQEQLTEGTHITIDNSNVIDVIVDDTLSDNSTHPVQNAVVKAALDLKIECSDDVEVDTDIDYQTLAAEVASLRAAVVELQASRIVNVETAAEMETLLVAANVGRVYRFIGETVTYNGNTYTQGALYQVEIGENE